MQKPSYISILELTFLEVLESLVINLVSEHDFSELIYDWLLSELIYAWLTWSQIKSACLMPSEKFLTPEKFD